MVIFLSKRGFGDIMLEKLSYILEQCWCKDTCCNKLKKQWTKKCKCLGQDAVTSLVLNDYLGGSIQRCYVNGVSHYFNIIDNNIVDLTKAQFDEETFSYQNIAEISRKYILNNNEIQKQYDLLKEHINSTIENYHGLNEMKLLDLYNNNRKITPKKVVYGHSIPKGYYYLTAVAFLQNSKGEFLIQKSSHNKNTEYNQYFSFHGVITSGEKSYQGIKRKIKEDLNLSINEDKLILFNTILSKKDFIDLYYIKQDVNLNILSYKEENVSDLQWMSKNEVLDLIKENQFFITQAKYFKLCLKYLEIQGD